MKRILFVTVLLFCSTFLFAQVITISGVVKPQAKMLDISLFRVEGGQLKVIATNTLLDGDSTFEFLLRPSYEGFYAIGSTDLNKGQFPLYFKKDETGKVNVVIGKKHIEYVGKLSAENIILANWVSMTDSLRMKAVVAMGSESTYKDFFPAFSAVEPKTDAFRKTINTKNKVFNKLMAEVTYFDMDFFALSLLQTPRIEHPQKSEFIPYYASIVQKDKFPNDDVLSTIWGARYMSMYANYATGMSYDRTTEDRLAVLTTDKQKGEYLWYSKLAYVKSYDQYNDIMAKYAQYFKSTDLAERVQKLTASLVKTMPGGKAFDFTYPDKDGEMISLSDLKGKVVLVDVWATWCVPCLKEIPNVKKLAEDFKGKDLVILGVSIDKEAAKKSWLQMTATMEGIQLYANGGEKILKDYEIGGIPRFMVFDKKGNIVSTEAPPPSDPRLKEMLEAELKK